MTEIELDDPGIRAVSLAGGGRQATVALNTNYPYHDSPPVKQFTLAHELCHLLFDQRFGVELARNRWRDRYAVWLTRPASGPGGGGDGVVLGEGFGVVGLVSRVRSRSRG
jgi:hypothetical protein